MKKAQYKEWLNKQDFDLIYNYYLGNITMKPLLESLNSPMSWGTLGQIMKRKGYKMRTLKEANTFKNQSPLYKANHSRVMKEVVKRVPEQYLGRYRGRKMKTFEDIDYLGNKCTHLGSWEALIAKLLTENNIHWIKEQHSFDYIFNNSIHSYYPDFYLPDFDLYIEVKGMETEKDRAKWRDFPNNRHLFIIKGDKLISQLKKGEVNILQLLKIEKES